MATHSSVLAWRIPGAEEPGGLPSMGSHRIRQDWRNLAAAAATYSNSPILVFCSKKLKYRISTCLWENIQKNKEYKENKTYL